MEDDIETSNSERWFTLMSWGHLPQYMYSRLPLFSELRRIWYNGSCNVPNSSTSFESALAALCRLSEHENEEELANGLINWIDWWQRLQIYNQFVSVASSSSALLWQMLDHTTRSWIHLPPVTIQSLFDAVEQELNRESVQPEVWRVLSRVQCRSSSWSDLVDSVSFQTRLRFWQRTYVATVCAAASGSAPAEQDPDDRPAVLLGLFFRVHLHLAREAFRPWMPAILLDVWVDLWEARVTWKWPFLRSVLLCSLHGLAKLNPSPSQQITPIWNPRPRCGEYLTTDWTFSWLRTLDVLPYSIRYLLSQGFLFAVLPRPFALYYPLHEQSIACYRRYYTRLLVHSSVLVQLPVELIQIIVQLLYA